MVGRFTKGSACGLVQLVNDPAGKFRMGVKAAAHGRTSQGKFRQPLFAVGEAFTHQSDLPGVAAEFIPQRHGDGILQMGAP
jgi:hypothetical protein